MSGWTILTVRGREAKDYDYTREDSSDPWDAVSDIVATMDADDRVRRWTTWSGHVYAYLNCSRYDFEFAEALLESYAVMVADAVVLGANNTSDTGRARYYPHPEQDHTDDYQETQAEDGTYVGELALCVMNARHGIVARDPFHNECGSVDAYYLGQGVERLRTDTDPAGGDTA